MEDRSAYYFTEEFETNIFDVIKIVNYVKMDYKYFVKVNYTSK